MTAFDSPYLVNSKILKLSWKKKKT
jgi:hypothetical protein